MKASPPLRATPAKALTAALVFLMIALAGPAAAQDPFTSALAGIPAFSAASAGEGATTYSLSMQILALLTMLTVLPSLVLGATSFTRIIIVLSILRQALGTQQTPPNQVLIAIALFLTLYIMSPTLTAIYDTAVTPYLAGTLPAEQAVALASEILKGFMAANTQTDALLMFSDMAGQGPYATTADIPFSTLLPAFITSELKMAFQIGFLLFLPFLVIDMVVASILMSLGMMMLSPMLVSLPFKLLLFVLVDGWSMTVGSLAATFVQG